MFRLVLTVMLIASAAGCVAPLLLVGAGAVGGYAVSRDTFEGTTSKSLDELWDASLKIAGIMGSVDDNDRKRGEINAHINGAAVHITIIPINVATSRLRVKARKNLLPAVSIAQDFYTKVINQLEQ